MADRDDLRSVSTFTLSNVTSLDNLLRRNWNNADTVRDMESVLRHSSSSLHVYELGSKDNAHLYLETNAVFRIPYFTPKAVHEINQPHVHNHSPFIHAETRLDTLLATAATVASADLLEPLWMTEPSIALTIQLHTVPWPNLMTPAWSQGSSHSHWI